jgi:hypothetical protein
MHIACYGYQAVQLSPLISAYFMTTRRTNMISKNSTKRYIAAHTECHISTTSLQLYSQTVQFLPQPMYRQVVAPPSSTATCTVIQTANCNIHTAPGNGRTMRETSEVIWQSR